MQFLSWCQADFAECRCSQVEENREILFWVDSKQLWAGRELVDYVSEIFHGADCQVQWFFLHSQVIIQGHHDNQGLCVLPLHAKDLVL